MDQLENLEFLDPVHLLQKLGPQLTPSGGIKKNALKTLMDAMKKTDNKLVPKCTMLNILGASDQSILQKLCRHGVWDVIWSWLKEAVEDENNSFIRELLAVYKVLPVTLEMLTINGSPKAIKSLSKRGEPDIRELANTIIAKWKKLVKSNTVKPDEDEKGPPPKKLKIEAEKEIVEDTSSKTENPTTKTNNDKPTQDGVVKKRTHTVKIPPNKMRTAGLEESGETTAKSRSEILAKKGLGPNKNNQDTNCLTGDQIVNIHQEIKVTAPEKRRASHELHESSFFMDALTSAQPSFRKKKKAVHKPEVTPPPAKVAKKDGMESPTADVDSGPKKSALADIVTSFSSSKKRKSVTWVPEDRLEEIRYFALDETERVNVNHVPMEELKKKEHDSERQLIAVVKREHEEEDSFTLPGCKWRRPVQLTLDHTTKSPCGAESKERATQLERERTVLQAIYFTKESIPFSAGEPDAESFEAKEPLIIPQEDMNRQAPDASPKDQKETNPDLLIITQEEGDGETKATLNPDIAEFVKSLAANLASEQPTSSDLQQMPPSSTPSQGPSTSGAPATEHDQIRNELWDLLKSNYPHLDTNELTLEKVRELLEPLKDQLVERNVFSLPPNFGMGPRGFPRGMPPMGPLFPRGPPRIPPPGYGPPRRPMMRHQQMLGPPPNMQQGPPPQMPQGPPPQMRQGPPNPHGPPTRICRYFMAGTCYRGPSCSYLHPGINGPQMPGPPRMQGPPRHQNPMYSQ